MWIKTTEDILINTDNLVDIRAADFENKFGDVEHVIEGTGSRGAVYHTIYSSYSDSDRRDWVFEKITEALANKDTIIDIRRTAEDYNETFVSQP